jgi:zinc transport system substrate-binding protein
MKRLFIAFCIIIISFTLVLSGCARREENSGRNTNGTVNVVTTIFPPYDFVREIAGDIGTPGSHVNLTLLLPPGAESHSFEPTPQDIIRIQNSALFIYAGGESDSWVDRILDSLDTSKIKILSLMDTVDVVEEEIVEGMEEEEGEEEEGAEYDEHVWTSPKNAELIVKAITDALCEVDGVNADLYRRNADSYLAGLDELDAAFQSVVDNAKRKTIVFGDRFPFRYFADAYGLSYFAAFPGCSTETECSAATVAFLINKIKNEGIPVVFHIELSNEKIADTLCEETGAKKLLFHAGHNISKKDFDNGVTYLELQQANVDRLRTALQ